MSLDNEYCDRVRSIKESTCCVQLVNRKSRSADIHRDNSSSVHPGSNWRAMLSEFTYIIKWKSTSLNWFAGRHGKVPTAQ